MPKRFFKLTDDVYLSGRWELGHPLDQEGCKLDDPWQCKIGQRALPNERIRLPIKRLLMENPTVTGDGRYALAMALAQSVVWDEMMDAFKDMADPQAMMSAVREAGERYGKVMGRNAARAFAM